jgi:SAM-dependent methyltransferase
MASVTQNLFRLFRGDTAASGDAQQATSGKDARVRRHSSGLAEFTKMIAGQENLCILDLGPTSPQNIALLTGLGHRVYNEDVLLASFGPDFVTKKDDGTSAVNADTFLNENLKYQAQQFDAVLAWDIPDYLNESLVKAAVARMASVMKPGGVLLAFFHTRDAGPEAPYYRYHIAGKDSLDLQRGPQFRLQRVFNNRHIENLFREFSNIKFFLARDNVREVLVVR